MNKEDKKKEVEKAKKLLEIKQKAVEENKIIKK